MDPQLLETESRSLLTREEVRRLFRVNERTIDTWIRRGRLLAAGWIPSAPPQRPQRAQALVVHDPELLHRLATRLADDPELAPTLVVATLSPVARAEVWREILLGPAAIEVARKTPAPKRREAARPALARPQLPARPKVPARGASKPVAVAASAELDTVAAPLVPTDLPDATGIDAMMQPAVAGTECNDTVLQEAGTSAADTAPAPEPPTVAEPPHDALSSRLAIANPRLVDRLPTELIFTDAECEPVVRDWDGWAPPEHCLSEDALREAGFLHEPVVTPIQLPHRTVDARLSNDEFEALSAQLWTKDEIAQALDKVLIDGLEQDAMAKRFDVQPTPEPRSDDSATPDPRPDLTQRLVEQEHAIRSLAENVAELTAKVASTEKARAGTGAELLALQDRVEAVLFPVPTAKPRRRSLATAATAWVRRTCHAVWQARHLARGTQNALLSALMALALAWSALLWWKTADLRLTLAGLALASMATGALLWLGNEPEKR